jgi:hypothetical protein
MPEIRPADPPQKRQRAYSGQDRQHDPERFSAGPTVSVLMSLLSCSGQRNSQPVQSLSVLAPPEQRLQILSS